MAEGLNRVILSGNLCADPELRFTQGGQSVLNMRLAINGSYVDKNKERKETTEFVNCVLWGARAEALGKFLRKGSALLVEGSLKTSSYEKDGQKRYKTEVNVSNVILHGGKGDSGGSERSGSPRGRAPGPAADAPPADDYGGYSFSGSDDQIPF
jgi:single-strand DNA-binding protein